MGDTRELIIEAKREQGMQRFPCLSLIPKNITIRRSNLQIFIITSDQLIRRDGRPHPGRVRTKEGRTKEGSVGIGGVVRVGRMRRWREVEQGKIGRRSAGNETVTIDSS